MASGTANLIVTRFQKFLNVVQCQMFEVYTYINVYIYIYWVEVEPRTLQYSLIKKGIPEHEDPPLWGWEGLDVHSLNSACKEAVSNPLLPVDHRATLLLHRGSPFVHVMPKVGFAPSIPIPEGLTGTNLGVFCILTLPL